YVYYYKRETANFRPMLLGAAEVWRRWALQRQAAPNSGRHGPDMARFEKIMCLVYGADPATFEKAMDTAGISADRRQGCADQFAAINAAWDGVLKAHRRNVDPNLPGAMPTDAPGGSMPVEYGALTSPFAQKLGPVLQQYQLFELLAGSLGKIYVLPRN